MHLQHGLRSFFEDGAYSFYVFRTSRKRLGVTLEKNDNPGGGAFDNLTKDIISVG
jgi:hypothetical protein